MNKPLIITACALIALGAAAQIPVGGLDVSAEHASPARAPRLDLSAFSSAPPGQPLHLLFIHHSIGGQWLAPVGPESGEHSIYESHPNGGDLRRALTAEGYVVHEASYGSAAGDRTDLFDWLPKYRAQMDQILETANQDARLAGGARNRIVLWKSCFPNSDFVGRGAEPGDPGGPELTLANAKATMREVLRELARRPDVLFVYVTAPPLAPRRSAEPLWKLAAKVVLGRHISREAFLERGRIAREFNAWMASPEGWLAGYPHKNVVVFDYFDVLTGGGRSNHLAYPTGGGADSHPSAEGNRRASEDFVPFLNRAARRAGLLTPRDPT